MPEPTLAAPRIAVVVPTFDRAALLDRCLASFAVQSLEPDAMEIVVVDDGSRDETPALCADWRQRLPLEYARQARSGPSPARNLGLFLSRAPIVLFFDDDEVAAPTLLAEHLAAHEAHPGENVAVLGFTTWAPDLEITPVMHYVTEIGQFLLSYPSVPRDRPLDFSYFWTGRISCKRAFPTQFGIFSQRMRRLEDIELGFRLWRQGLEIRYWPGAVNFRSTPIDFPGFCRHCEIDGRALRRLAELHGDPALRSYCQVEEGIRGWSEVASELPRWTAAAADLEATVRRPFLEEDPRRLEELWELYRRCFLGYRWKGIAQGVPA